MKFEEQEAEASIRATATLYQSVRSQLLHLPATEHGMRPNGEWTKKEIVGHCCDGTAANLQRVVRTQYEESPPRSVYNQAEWVKIQNYSLYDESIKGLCYNFLTYDRLIRHHRQLQHP